MHITRIVDLGLNVRHGMYMVGVRYVIQYSVLCFNHCAMEAGLLLLLLVARARVEHLSEEARGGHLALHVLQVQILLHRARDRAAAVQVI